MKAVGLTLLLVFLSLGLEAEASVNSPELRFRAFTKLAGAHKINLSDIIDTDGLPADIVGRLKKIIIADAPRLGEQRVFTSQMLSGILRHQLKGRDYTVRIPNQIVVLNRGFEISEDVLQLELISKWKAECKDCRLKVRRVVVPALPAALKNRPWRIETKSGLPKGAFTERLIVDAQDGQEQYFWINGELTIERKVPVANRTLNANFRLTAEDFRLEWRDVTHATDGTLRETEMVGQQVRAVIPAGQIIWAGSMSREKAVKRGDMVRVTTGSDDWQIVLQAITEQDAYIGDKINVRNLQTKKLITGEVVAPGEVVVR